MIRVARDKDELGGVPFIAFNVWTYRPNEDEATVCGYHMFNYQEAGREILRGSAPLCLPVEQAFDEARRFAEERGISAIWINDPDRLFETAGM